MAEKALQPTLLVGTYDKVLFGFALHVDAPKGAPRFKPLFSAPGHLETIKSVAANSKFVCSGGQDETINVYNLRKRTELGALRQQDGSITALAFSGKFLLSGASDGSLVIWKSSDWSVASILRGHKSGILSLAVHPSQKACISIASDKKLRLWNLHTSKSAFTMALPALCEEVMWSPSAERFALLSRTAIYVYSSTSGELEAELKQKKPALCMTFVTEKEIAIGSEDFGIHLWDYAKGTERVHLKGHESRVRVLRTFAVGSKTYIVSGATDGTVLVWDPAQTEAVTRIETNCRVTCLTVTMAPQPEANSDDIIMAAPSAAAKRKIAEKEEAPADKVAKQAKTKETAPIKATDAKKPQQHKAAKPAAAAAKATKAAPKVAVEEEAAEADSVEDMDGSDSVDDDDDEAEAEIEAEEDGDSAGEEEASE